MSEDRKLTDIFVVPPISILDVKQKYWKDRRREWLAMNIQSELGRGENLLNLSALLQKKQKATSIFDPVLCEIMYKWFTMEGDTILDPFAGGSVRGIVASNLKRNYIGIDIREEQVQHNEQQATELCQSNTPRWIHGSSADVMCSETVDFIFTCPPYYDLEKYSKLDGDLSNMSTEQFDVEYAKIIQRAVDQLANNRFCAIIVGDVRGPDGTYLKFPQKTVQYFENAGCKLYNEMILLQEPATAAMRSFRYMNSSRKVAKSHQNVFVFVKGDPTIATERMPQFTDGKGNTSDLQGFM